MASQRTIYIYRKSWDYRYEVSPNGLAQAVTDGQFDAVKSLLGRGVDPNVPGGHKNVSLVFYCMREPGIVRLLLDAGLDLNVWTRSGKSPVAKLVQLHHEAWERELDFGSEPLEALEETLGMLLRNGAWPRAPDDCPPKLRAMIERAADLAALKQKIPVPLRAGRGRL